MIKARIAVDLPSAEYDRRLGPIEWVRTLFGAEIDLRSGREELTIGAFSLLEGTWRAFQRVGVHDAISFLVDKRVIYLDTNEVTHDLDLVWQSAGDRGVLDAKFKEMHLVCTHHEGGLHVLFDVRVTADVVLGDAEMVVDVSARPEELRIQAGETAEAFSARVKQFSADEGKIEQHRLYLDDMVRELGAALEREIVGARVLVDRAEVKVVRPGARQIAKFGKLGFGGSVAQAQYRPTPSAARTGAYADPFVYYWYDPYWDLTSWILIDAMLHDHHWSHASHVHVVDGGGSELFTGASASDYASSADGWGSDAVSFTDDGVSVDTSALPSDGDGGSSSWGDGWGSSDVGSSDGWGGSDVGGSDSGGSSCGSSCSSGSSCGSSCGGGCGGGGD
jgi:hypothetical protein